MRKVIHTLERLAALGLRPRPAASAATPPGRRGGGGEAAAAPHAYRSHRSTIPDLRMTSG